MNGQHIVTDTPPPDRPLLREIKAFAHYAAPFTLTETFSVPLVPIGIAWWPIQDANGETVTSVMFRAPDASYPDHDAYVEAQRIRAQSIADALTAVAEVIKPHMPDTPDVVNLP